ncbi:Squamous cell carcinoma antigen recognized by T-cells 3 [Tritrichomonas musculus]|uniref:Squamous cell carcinoma antigen recognized by T-cells 3 n=1 Tax=Tritrichomonas musculus TaxID=1915356 RepID=A0ABR2LC43_9EUKA
MDNEIDAITKVVLVQNVNYIVSEDDIRRFFENCGTIKKIRIIVDKRGKPKGNVYVAFENHDMALNALSKDEKRLLDRYVFVDQNKSPNMEKEMTQGEEILKFKPMLGKPYSENQLILEAYDELKKQKEKEEEIQKEKEKLKEEEEKRKEEEKINNAKEISVNQHKKHKNSQKDKSYHRKHHRDMHHRHHKHHNDDSDDDDRPIYYSEIPDMA